MNIVERAEERIFDKFDRFGEVMLDGRLTAPSNGKTFRLREAILLSKQLRRPLSQEEMEEFEV